MYEQQGKFKKINLKGKSIEKWCKEQCINQGQTKKYEDETWEELFFNMHDDEYFIVNNEVYQILRIEYLEDYCYVQVNKQDNDIYSFHVIYHDNGVNDLIECLKEGLNNI